MVSYCKTWLTDFITNYSHASCTTVNSQLVWKFCCMGDGWREGQSVDIHTKRCSVKQIFKIKRWSMHLGPGHSIVRENRLKLPSCRSATLLVSAVSPTNHLASEEEGILAACASALDCRKNSGFTVKFHDFSLFSC